MSLPKISIRAATIVLAAAALAALPARSTSASVLQIIAPTPTLLPGQSEIISVQFTSTQNFTLASADIEIAYDNTRFSVSNASLGTLDTTMNTGYDYAISNNPISGNPGVLYAEIDSAQSQATIAVGQTGSLETFTLTALANAPVGGAVGDINLLANASNSVHTATAVYDISGAIVSVTTPTQGSISNGLDSSDGTVVISPAVPEPSSLILMGVGGGLIALTSRFRKKKARRSPAA